jgi:type IV pilus assembly protein PilX
MRSDCHLPKQQQGVVLIVVLVFTLMLTIIGINSMDTSTVEIKMASSAQQQTIALSRAEATLLEAETAIDKKTFTATTDSDGYYLPAEAVTPAISDWSSLESETAATDGSRYIIQYIGSRPIPGESHGMQKQSAGSDAYLHRITVQSGAGKSAARQIQTLYVTDFSPLK